MSLLLVAAMVSLTCSFEDTVFVHLALYEEDKKARVTIYRPPSLEPEGTTLYSAEFTPSMVVIEGERGSQIGIDRSSLVIVAMKREADGSLKRTGGGQCSLPKPTQF